MATRRFSTHPIFNSFSNNNQYFSDHENFTTIPLPLNLISRYDDNYYCLVTQIQLKSNKIRVNFDARGDSSSGPLQQPQYSLLSLVYQSWIPSSSSEVEVVIPDRQYTGWLEFDVERYLLNQSILFQYAGFSSVRLLKLDKETVQRYNLFHLFWAHPTIPNQVPPSVSSTNVHVVKPSITTTTATTTTTTTNPLIPLTEAEECIICVTERKTAGFLHGNTVHQACCLHCANGVKTKGQPCPVCRLPIERVVQIFKV